MQSVYFLPVERRLAAGEELSLTVCHDDYSLWYSLQSRRYRRTQSITSLPVTPVFYCVLYVTVEHCN